MSLTTNSANRNACFKKVFDLNFISIDIVANVYNTVIIYA